MSYFGNETGELTSVIVKVIRTKMSLANSQSQMRRMVLMMASSGHGRQENVVSLEEARATFIT